MEPPSPARLYATVIGAVLFVGGILGFFHDLSWLNYLYVAGGAVGLLLAGVAARPYALCVGTIYTALAVGDFASRGWPHLVVGLLGLAAFASTRGSLSIPEVQKEPRDRPKPLKPRAKAAAKGS
jgi:hypothetical protein